jgi:hypothetical protein
VGWRSGGLGNGSEPEILVDEPVNQADKHRVAGDAYRPVKRSGVHSNFRKVLT